jgi:hypothetical protein
MTNETADNVSLESPKKNLGGRPKGSSTKDIDPQVLSNEEIVGNLKVSKRLRHIVETVIGKIEDNPDNVAPADLKLLDTLIKQLAVLAVQAKDIGKSSTGEGKEGKAFEDGREILGDLLK